MRPWPFDVRLVMLSGVCVVKPYIDWLKLLKFSRMNRPFAANSSSLLGFHCRFTVPESRLRVCWKYAAVDFLRHEIVGIERAVRDAFGDERAR